MPSYLVETYLAREQVRERAARERQARSVAEELTQGTTRVRFDRSIHVPEDEICFYVFDAPTARVAAHAAERAGLDPIRVVEAVSSRARYRGHFGLPLDHFDDDQAQADGWASPATLRANERRKR